MINGWGFSKGCLVCSTLGLQTPFYFHTISYICLSNKTEIDRRRGCTPFFRDPDLLDLDCFGYPRRHPPAAQSCPCPVGLRWGVGTCTVISLIFYWAKINFTGAQFNWKLITLLLTLWFVLSFTACPRKKSKYNVEFWIEWGVVISNGAELWRLNENILMKHERQPDWFFDSTENKSYQSAWLWCYTAIPRCFDLFLWRAGRAIMN